MKYLVVISGIKNNGRKKLNDIDTLTKYYFDRTFDNYSCSINKKYVTENFVAKDIKSKLNEMDSSLSTLDKVFA